MDKLTFLSNVKIFKQIESDKLQRFAEKFKLVSLEKGTALISEGTEDNSLWIIKSGSVEITKGLNQTGDEARLTILEEYDCVGEMSVFGLGERSANVIALTDIEAYQIKGEDFLKLCYANPITMFNLLNTMSERLSQTNNKIAEMVDSFIMKNKLFTLSQTLSKIMHDVRVPLTSIFISCQLMSDEFPETSEYLGEINKSAEKISEIIEEIVEFVKGNQVDLYFEKYSTKQLFPAMESYIKKLSKFKNLTIHWDNNAPEHYYLDIVRFRRLFDNLAKNAVNAVADDGNIYLSFSGREDYIKFSIKDDGPGISEEKLTHLYEPFKTNSTQKGKGIGLAICKKIVNDHGGTISYSRADTGGAEFYVELPIIMN